MKTTIGNLPPAATLTGAEEIPVEQSGFTRKTTAKTIVESAGARTIPSAWTFSASPEVPTPTASAQAAPKGYVDSVAAGVPSGVMLPYGGAAAPSGWLLCDGTAVSRTTYAGLFTAIGTAFGVGDGSTTFNLPDMRAAAPVGAGTSTGYTQNETIALGTKYNDQIQDHSHGALIPNAATGNYGVGAGNVGPTATSVGASTFSTNGTPRTGNVTRGKVVGVNYIIKE